MWEWLLSQVVAVLVVVVMMLEDSGLGEWYCGIGI